ncbi:MAG: hypothetical protein Q9160_003894 [Pyrenula sp. 1 TL-2023]
MPVKTIYLLRHGHRLGWILDHRSGTYTPASHVRFPTGIATDPPLASHGVKQAQETAVRMVPLLTSAAEEGKLRIYSSLYYRCLETLKPTVEGLKRAGWPGKVRGERGVGEWFGQAWFSHPGPEKANVLSENFLPWLDGEYKSRITPPEKGETIEELHDRIARAFEQIIAGLDEESAANGEDLTLLVSGHAAPIICSGRVLTGHKPSDWAEEDFRCFTCGISKFTRRSEAVKDVRYEGAQTQISEPWWSYEGIAGGWDCIENSSCEHLSSGEERGWHFNGDESFNVHVGLLNESAKSGQAAQSGSNAPRDRL